MPILLSLPLLAPAVHAAEVQFEGSYRARMRAFDTLSLDRTSLNDLGLTAYAQHRLWLAPRFLISDKVSMFVQVQALNGVPWGMSQREYEELREPQYVPPNIFEYDLAAPTSDTDGSTTLLDITLWRAWGEVYTPIGEFTFGRVPLLWGQGIWLNDGLSIDPLYADYGDTTDRVMWEQLIQDQFYLRATVDVPVEGLLEQNDDTTAVGFGVAYKAEDLTAGILLQVDHSGPDRDGVGGPLNVFTADASGDVTLGKLNVAAEVVGQFGGGDVGNIVDGNITALGAALDSSLDLDAFRVRLRGGFASGDATPIDGDMRAFTFDRDYSLGLFLFEQPMPRLEQVGDTPVYPITTVALTNAIFVKPTVSRRLVDGLWVDASWLGARAARLPEINEVAQRRGYGNELQLGATYDGVEHFLLDARGAVFLPGTVYSIGYTDDLPDTGFDDPAFGFQLTGRIEF